MFPTPCLIIWAIYLLYTYYILNYTYYILTFTYLYLLYIYIYIYLLLQWSTHHVHHVMFTTSCSPRHGHHITSPVVLVTEPPSERISFWAVANSSGSRATPAWSQLALAISRHKCANNTIRKHQLLSLALNEGPEGQPSASTLCINPLHQSSTSTLCINPLHQSSASILCINPLHQPSASTLYINPLHQPSTSTLQINPPNQPSTSTL